MNPNEQMLELCGQVENIVYRNEQNGYTVIELIGEDSMLTAVGIMPMVSVGEIVRLLGTFKSHPSYGEQFSVSACERSLPENLDGILKYLSSGAIKGIGPATATRLVNEFKSETLSILENEPERVAKMKGITLQKAKAISEQLKQAVGIKELLSYLSAYSITPQSAVMFWKCYGNNAISVIEENPYTLCEDGFDVSFETADLIAKSQSRPNDERVRVRAGLAHVLMHNRLNGHTCLPYDKLCQAASRLLEVEYEVASSALDEMIEDNSLTLETFDNKDFVFTNPLHLSETYISARLQMLLRFPAVKISNVDKQIEAIEKENGILYADLQKKAIFEALDKGLLILTGGPGTGKTTTLNAIIRILKQNGQKVCLCAPTGRAAQRMSELTKEESKTIHRLLEVSWDTDDKPVFKKNERNMLNCDALIVDEVSMVDSVLFESLVRALPLSCRLILVGDSDQLPSVGAGNVLSDLISSNTIPVVSLSEIFRQSMKSLIVTNAHKIVNGEMPETNIKDNDFFFLHINSQQDVANTIVDLCTNRLVKSYGYSSTDDIQVLSPTRKGILGTQELNARLQEVINPKSKDKTEITSALYTLREGDKVMQVKNNYNIPWTKKNGEFGEGVFNGDIGKLFEINKASKTVKVIFDDKIAVYDFDSVSDLEPAYATTVHKSQGNEFEAVVMPMCNIAPQLMYRNLLYTAVTRAKKLLILVGNENALKTMIDNNKRILRYTGLKEFLLRGE